MLQFALQRNHSPSRLNRRSVASRQRHYARSRWVREWETSESVHYSVVEQKPNDTLFLNWAPRFARHVRNLLPDVSNKAWSKPLTRNTSTLSELRLCWLSNLGCTSLLESRTNACFYRCQPCSPTRQHAYNIPLLAPNWTRRLHRAGA